MEVLYLTHRMPYPPDKGDKIRTYNILKALTERATVHLGCFVDNAADWEHADTVRAMCGETHFVNLSGFRGKVRAAKGLLSGSSITLPYFFDPSMRDWVKSLGEQRRVSHALAFSSSMGQYLEHIEGDSTGRVVDFCDLDSDKWRQYAERSAGPKRWLFRREASRLALDENRIGKACEASVFISDEEVDLFVRQSGLPRSRVFEVRNGVDTDYFDPALSMTDPLTDGDRNLVFVGAMDYWPNVDAVSWFVEEILPAVRRRVPDTKLWIVGSNPSSTVEQLGKTPGVVVTGRVADVRPYLKFASCVVAPLRVARGVQNKVLEAMAMGQAIVASPEALEGLGQLELQGVAECRSVDDWTNAVCRLLDEEPSGQRSDGVRRYVSEHFSWEASGQTLATIMAAIGGDPDVADDGPILRECSL